jgi:CRP-like cAMP-binding protein
MSQEDLDSYFSNLHQVSLSLRQILYEAGAPLEYVYFIEEGVASILTTMADGSTIEVGMIGVEGMVGVLALLGGNLSAQQVIVQIPGTALRMNAALCKAAFDQSAAIRKLALRFTEATLNLSAQTAACNRLHSIEQRCARWGAPGGCSWRWTAFSRIGYLSRTNSSPRCLGCGVPELPIPPENSNAPA